MLETRAVVGVMLERNWRRGRHNITGQKPKDERRTDLSAEPRREEERRSDSSQSTGLRQRGRGGSFASGGSSPACVCGRRELKGAAGGALQRGAS